MARVSAIAAFPTAAEVYSTTGVSSILGGPCCNSFPAVVGFPAVAGVPAVADDPVVVVALLLL
jgi:hypothetical protein